MQSFPNTQQGGFLLKRILSILLVIMFVALGNTAIFAAKKPAVNTIAAGQTTLNLFEDKAAKTKLTAYLKQDFLTKNFGSASDWTIWARPSLSAINGNALRIQMVGKDEALSFVNIELSTSYTKTPRDLDNVLELIQNFYNLMFPERVNDGFLKKNFAAVTKNSSFTVTRDNVVFEFSYFEKAQLKQVIIRPKI